MTELNSNQYFKYLEVIITPNVIEKNIYTAQKTEHKKWKSSHKKIYNKKFLSCSSELRHYKTALLPEV